MQVVNFRQQKRSLKLNIRKEKQRRIVGFVELIIWRFYRIGRCVDGQVSWIDNRILSLANLNALAQAASTLSTDDIKKLGAVVTLAKPQNAEQVKNLAENLDLFDFAPGVHSPAEYVKYMIQQSGHFDYDADLDDFYDYEGYALQRMNNEDGMFTDRGYIAYKGYFSFEEIMEGGQGGSMEMGRI